MKNINSRRSTFDNESITSNVFSLYLPSIKWWNIIELDIKSLDLERKSSEMAKVELLKQNIPVKYGKVTFIGKNLEDI